MIAYLDENSGGKRQIYFRSRPEANHPEAFPFLEFVADVGPRYDTSRDRAGDLPHNNRDARVLKGPRHRFVFLRTIGTSRVEKKPGAMLPVNDAAINHRPIRLHSEERAET